MTLGLNMNIQYSCSWGFGQKTWVEPSIPHLETEIQGNLEDKNRKCFGTSKSLVAEFVCWKQFWSNSTPKVGGRSKGMSAGAGRGRPETKSRPAWEPAEPGHGEGKGVREPPGRCSGKHWRTDGTWFYSGGFIYSKVNPLQGSEAALWALPSALDRQLVPAMRSGIYGLVFLIPLHCYSAC